MRNTPTRSRRGKAVHLQNLAAIFGYTLEGVTVLYRHLKINETHGSRLALNYCNGEITEEEFSTGMARLKSNVRATLRDARSEAVGNIIFNSDPRGHFLKLSDEYVRKNKLVIETDWGGYGIICPEGV